MIDTTSINFALSKISEGWQKAAPAIQGIGEKYVHYTVTKAMLFPLPFLLAMVPAFIIARFCGKRIKADVSVWEIPTGIAICALLVFGGIAIWGIFNAALAALNPEMYTVQSVIDAARSK